MRIRKGLVAAAVLALTIAGVAAPASAADSQSGSRSCSANYSVGLKSTTAGINDHTHRYNSSGAITYRYSPGLVQSFSSRSVYRVATWQATTPGFFSGSAVSNCVINPV